MLSLNRERELREFEKNIGISFLNKTLLNQALTHSSFAYEHRSQEIFDNERLEFLGDAVLKLVISEYLFHKFPEKQEGDLTKIRAAVISDVSLAEVARKWHIGDYVLLGANEKKTGGRTRRSNLANALESLLGAIFIDAGLGKSRDFILEILKERLEKTSRKGFIADYKSTFQEQVQKMKCNLPEYKVIKETGPKHQKIFWIQVKVKGRIFGYGQGPTKKEAEQQAAKEALARLKKENISLLQPAIEPPEEKNPLSTEAELKKHHVHRIIDRVKKRMRLM